MLKPQRWIASLAPANPKIIHLRDGELVLYKRPNNAVFQCRFKLADGKWHRASTHKLSLEHAISVACDLYDEARYRQRLGLAHTAQSFAHIAQTTINEMRNAVDAGRGKVIFKDYIKCIEMYFIPYFGDMKLEELNATDVLEFEAWRNRQLRRAPSG